MFSAMWAASLLTTSDARSLDSCFTCDECPTESASLASRHLRCVSKSYLVPMQPQHTHKTSEMRCATTALWKRLRSMPRIQKSFSMHAIWLQLEFTPVFTSHILHTLYCKLQGYCFSPRLHMSRVQVLGPGGGRDSWWSLLTSEVGGGEAHGDQVCTGAY